MVNELSDDVDLFCEMLAYCSLAFTPLYMLRAASFNFKDLIVGESTFIFEIQALLQTEDQ